MGAAHAWTFTVRVITEWGVYWDINMEMFRVTNYNSVTMMNNLPGWKMEFVGNITPSGTGEFSFILHDVTFQNGGHYRCYKPSSNTSAAEVPGCGQKLVVVDFQQPYIVAPETAHLDRSVTLSCCSIAYAHTGHGVNVSINWWRNGLLVDISKYNTIDGSIYITDVTTHSFVRYHTSRSTLTLSDISTSKGDNFQCQALAGAEMISRWSEVFTLVQQSGSTENYTVVREGHAALFSLKIPVRENFIIEAPRNGWLFEVDSLWVYIFYIYWTRVNIQRVTTSADAAVIEFWLHNAVSDDAGTYNCFRWYLDPFPNCPHVLYVQVTDFQQPYIVAPETAHVDRSVTLSCFSVFELYGGGDVKLTVSMKWKRNGLLVSDRIKNNVTEENHTWNGHRRYYRSTLTFDDTAKGDNFQCQAVVGLAVVSGWSEEYQQVKQLGSYQDYTLVREGHSAFVIWKMPLVDEDFFVEAPRYVRVFEVKFPRIYINDPYRARVNLTKVTTSADSVIVQFWLHNTTLDDAGKYHCFTLRHDPIPNCHHMLHVQGPEVGELTVNGTESTTVKENQVVVFRCMVGDYLSPDVSLMQENSLAAVNMSRKQLDVYEHVMVVRKCSQLGVYSCTASNAAGSSEDEQHKAILKGLPHAQASHVFVTNGVTPSIVINITLCSYPGPSKPKWRLTQPGKLKDITDMKKYYPATKKMRHNVFKYSLVINNVTDADFGVYIFSVEYNHSSADFIIPASRMTGTPETSLHLVAGSSVSAVIVALAIIAGVILSRLNQLRDYWNLRFRSCITPTQNMPENIDDREYAEIDDAVIPERGDCSIVQLVVNVPPACGERQQLEGEDDEYDEVRPLHATNREERPTEQERRSTVQQPDKEIQDAIKDERTLPDSQPHSELRIVAADWSADGREFGDFAAVSIDQFEETSFGTQEPNETVTDKFPAARGKYSGAGGMTEANHPLVDGREDFAETLDLPCDRYESLMSPQPQPTYTALDNADDIAHDKFANMCHKYRVKPAKVGKWPKHISNMTP